MGKYPNGMTKREYEKLVKINFTISEQDKKEEKKIKKINENYKMEEGIYGLRIPLPMYELLKNKLEWMVDGSNFISITGSTGTGKTVQLLSLIPYFTNLSQIIICSLKIGDPAHKAIEDYANNNNIEYAFCYEPEMTMDTIEEYGAKKNPKTYGCVIFDDFTGANRYSNSDIYNKIVSEFFCKARGSGYHSIMITQDTTSLIPLVRTNTNVRIIYPMARKIAVQKMSEDFPMMCPQHEAEEFITYYKIICKPENKYSFMIIAKGHMWLYINQNKTVKKYSIF